MRKYRTSTAPKLVKCAGRTEKGEPCPRTPRVKGPNGERLCEPCELRTRRQPLGFLDKPLNPDSDT